MNDIPEQYRGEVVALCRLYNRQHAENHIDPASISPETDLKDIGLRHIDILGMEATLERKYPAIDGLAQAHGIDTVGDVINYMQRRTIPSLSL
jgi:hypothetical protein